MTNTTKLSKIKDLKIIPLSNIINYDCVDYDFMQENLTELLKEKLKENKISFFDTSLKLFYSLSYSQGDGLCFEGDFIFNGVNFYLRHNNGDYFYKESVNIEVEENDDDLSELLKDKLKEMFEQIYFNICDELEKMGYEEIEYREEEYILKKGFKEWKEENDFNDDLDLWDIDYLTEHKKGYIKICSDGDTNINGLWIKDTKINLKTDVEVKIKKELEQ